MKACSDSGSSFCQEYFIDSAVSFHQEAPNLQMSFLCNITDIGDLDFSEGLQNDDVLLLLLLLPNWLP